VIDPVGDRRRGRHRIADRRRVVPYRAPMIWARLDGPTKSGVIATVLAVLGLAFPLLAVTSAVVAVACSGAALARSRRRDEANRVAQICLAISLGIIVLIVVGTAIYVAAD
jgi:hypothetical protein